MSLSKKSKRGIAIFNQECRDLYRISYKTPLDLYTKAYQTIHDKTNSEVGEVAGDKVS